MKKSAAISVIIILFLTGCVKSSEPFSRTEVFFDTSVTITLYGNDKNYSDDIFEICSKYDLMLDRFNSESTVSRLNLKGSLKVEPELIDMITLSEELAPEGTFDILVAPFLDLWGFGDSSKEHVPEKEEIDDILKAYPEFGIEIDTSADTVTLLNGASLEFGGIAKGYVCDRISDYLVEKKVSSALLSLGSSSIMLIGSKPDGSDFRVGLQKPFAPTGEFDYILEASDCAVASSGPYERYFTEDGVIYHQIIDPSTGFPADSDLNGVTVITDNGTAADVLSTSLYIMGFEKGMAYVEAHDTLEAVFFDHENSPSVSSGLSLSENRIRFK